MNRLVHFFKAKPVFLLLLPAFFVLHGFTRHYYAVSVTDAILLGFFYIAGSVILVAISWFIFRDIKRGALLAFLCLSWYLFFGNLQDGLKLLSNGFISQYRFILPVSLVVFVSIFLWLRKSKTSLEKMTTYLTMLFLVLIAIDSAWLISKITRNTNYIAINETLDRKHIPADCKKPDIYLLLVDQYAGNNALKNIFHFDNAVFLDALKERGFYIAQQSTSNYNLTPFSMASMLSMSYLPPDMSQTTGLNVSSCYQAIRHSSVIKFLSGNGYRFYNYSLFDFPGQPAHRYESFLPYGTSLITMSTFGGRVKRDINFAIREGKFRNERMRNKIVYANLHFNDSIFNFTRNAAMQRNGAPKFIYSHFMLPHFPYYFDSKGNPLSLEKITDNKRVNSADYIEYLQYGNKKIMQLIDDIVSNSPTPPVILLLSDHGARSLEKGKEHSNDFVNLSAVLLPARDYSNYYDSISNVNQFRVLFNSCFKQQLSLLKDSVNDVRIYQ